MKQSAIDLFSNRKSAENENFLSFAEYVISRMDEEEWEDLPKIELAVALEYAWENLSAYKDIRRPLIDIQYVNLKKEKRADLSKTTKNHSFIQVMLSNRPFIVDTISAILVQHGLSSVMIEHRVFTISKSDKGDINKISLSARGQNYSTKNDLVVSCFFAIVERVLSEEEKQALQQKLSQALNHVYLATEDWRVMIAEMTRAVASLRNINDSRLDEYIHESKSFLEWVLNNHFTFLGIHRLPINAGQGVKNVAALPEEKFGIFRDDNTVLMQEDTLFAVEDDFVKSGDIVVVAKADFTSKIHRLVRGDYIGLKEYDSEGNAIAELRVIGLFTSSAYHQSVGEIPLIRRKQSIILEKFGFLLDGHSGKALINILDNFPRDELFQIRTPILTGLCQKLLKLFDKPKIRVFLNRERFGRSVTAQVFIPRDRYNSHIRIQLTEMLEEKLNGEMVEFEPSFLESQLTRVYFTFSLKGEIEKELGQLEKEVEAFISIITTPWEEQYNSYAQAHEASNQALTKKQQGSILSPTVFPADYRENFSIEEALHHAEIYQGLCAQNPFHVELRHNKTIPGTLRLEMMKIGEEFSLSARVPSLENAGFQVISEFSYKIQISKNEALRLYVMNVAPKQGFAPSTQNEFNCIEQNLIAVFNKRVDDDALNTLSMSAQLHWREVAIIRLYARYLQQLGQTSFSDQCVPILCNQPLFTQNFVKAFHILFDPAQENPQNKRLKLAEDIFADMNVLIQGVNTAEEERILTFMLNVLKATLRTNYYKESAFDDLHRFQLAIKLSPHDIPDIVEPKPYREIFTTGTHVEGVHMRFGPIARGGLRWSDRARDFRTEILGLVKAQQVKNAVIVPVGAKGGFIPRITPISDQREDVFENGKDAYKKFISTLISITDNRIKDQVIAPTDLVAYDDVDPYLVVAADKGTATFSDTANAISAHHDFWLDDAFASGGSQGYDHKVMGITARGGWEAVKRHFREKNKDIQSEEFTVAGVGDMSGDVFGNGMLLSQYILLIAAFDHRHIFIDPAPDAAMTYQERKRIFDLGRSSWADYNEKLLSKGGMIIPRNAKHVDLSEEAAKAIGLKKARYSPIEVMKAILKADVDLLWFGGIGTYIKSRSESQSDAGDRSNDLLRINGDEVRAKVIGEGANLGVTQLGRIEYAQNGGSINTDAIDNSAGVNSSDLEVNIKIAFKAAMEKGELDFEKRNKILADMTEQVGEQVLQNNYRQTLALSMAEYRGAQDLPFQNALMIWLEKHAGLDRDVEFLPNSAEMKERIRLNQPLSRPEMSVLMAYAKNQLLMTLQQSEQLKDEFYHHLLLHYFPEKMRKKFEDVITSHRLKEGIIATELANGLINRAGITSFIQLEMELGASNEDIAKSYIIAREAFQLLDLFMDVENLDNKIAGQKQLALFVKIQDYLLEAMAFILKAGDMSQNISAQIKQFGDYIGKVTKAFEKDALMSKRAREEYEKRIEQYENYGLSKSKSLALLPEIMLSLSQYSRNYAPKKLTEVLKNQYIIGENIGISALMEHSENQSLSGMYEILATRSLQQNILSSVGEIAAFINKDHPIETMQEDEHFNRLTELIHSIDPDERTIAQMTLISTMVQDFVNKFTRG